MEIITSPGSIANAIFNVKESVFVGRESVLLSEENQNSILQNQKHYAVMVEQHHHCLVQKLQNVESLFRQLKVVL